MNFFCCMYRKNDMYSSFFFLSIFCGIISTLQLGNVAARPDAADMTIPSSWTTIKTRDAIDFSVKHSPSIQPLTIYTPLKETCLVNMTKKEIKVTVLNQVTVSTSTGGILGKQLYQFYAYSFAWKTCKCGYQFQAYVIETNTKYDSYEEALKHKDGIIVITFPITTSGNYSNPKFNAYGDFFKCQLKDGKTYGTINSGDTYVWFANFPQGGIYTSCIQKYRDPNTGVEVEVVVIGLPSDPGVNFISSEQFQTFLKMGDSMGESLLSGTCCSVQTTHKGIVLYQLPA